MFQFIKFVTCYRFIAVELKRSNKLWLQGFLTIIMIHSLRCAHIHVRYSL